MKKNLKLNSMLSFKAIESKARKAAALAAFTATAASATPAKTPTLNHPTAPAKSGKVAKRAAANPGTATKMAANPWQPAKRGISPKLGKANAESNPKTKAKPKAIPTIEREIRSIFRVLSARASEHDRVVLERPDKGASYVAVINIYREEDLNCQKSTKPVPYVKYVFYSNTIDRNRLDSIAIYGADAAAYHSSIVKRGSFFGRKVVGATLEMGRRWFVDVKLAV